MWAEDQSRWDHAGTQRVGAFCLVNYPNVAIYVLEEVCLQRKPGQAGKRPQCCLKLDRERVYQRNKLKDENQNSSKPLV